MTQSEETVIQLLGPIYNFCEKENATPIEQAHEAGLTFVAMDANAYGDFRGASLSNEWVVARKLNGEIPQLNGWPNTGWRFQDEAKAKDAYAKMRAHIVARLPGAQAIADKSPERELNDAESALGEAFVVDGEEAVYLSCDKATEARILAMLTDRLEPYSTHGEKPQKFASYSSQIAAHGVGVSWGEQGAEQIVVAFSPGNEMQLVADGLKQSVRETDLKPFTLEVPSGILVVAWGRHDARDLLGEYGVQEGAMFIDKLMGEAGAKVLETQLEQWAPGPTAWAIRVRPGTYGVALRWLQTEEGISSMALSHLEAKPLWNDQVVRAAPAKTPAAPAKTQAEQIAAAQAAFAQLQSGAAGDPDPVVFPGQKLEKLSDYVKLMKGMQTGDMMGALNRAGLDMMSYSQVATAWGQKMATDPTLTAKFSALLMKA